MSDTRKEARERGNGEKKGVALLSFVPRSCVFSWIALLRPSRRHSRVLAWLASQDTWNSELARRLEKKLLYLREKVSISIVRLMWEGKIRYSGDKKHPCLMTHADFNNCRSLSMSQLCHNWPWNHEEQSPPERYLDQRSHFPIIQWSRLKFLGT